MVIHSIGGILLGSQLYFFIVSIIFFLILANKTVK